MKLLQNNTELIKHKQCTHQFPVCWAWTPAHYAIVRCQNNACFTVKKSKQMCLR